MENVLVKYISEAFDIDISDQAEKLETMLAEKINYLVVHDFSSLVNILYRIDVSEQKLKILLRENKDENAGKIIAALVIERQLEKIRSRQQGRDAKNNIDENESW